MAKSLPPAPSLEHLKKQAKALHAGHASRTPEAARLIAGYHPDYVGLSESDIFAAKFTLSDAQLVIARDYGFASWPKLKQYLDEQAAPSHSDWVSAVLEKDFAALQRLLGAHPHLANSLHREFDDPYRQKRFPVATLLFAAAAYPVQTAECAANQWPASRDTVKLLLDAGADPDIYSHHGRPLCHVSDPKTAQLLVDRGADINLWHDNGGSPLNFTVWREQPERTRLFLDLGANPNILEPVTGQSCLHYAGEGEAVDECVRLLLAAGADPNRRCAANPNCRSYLVTRFFPDQPLAGETPLHRAALHGGPRRIELLLSYGADRRIETSAGETACDWARRAGRTDDITRLLAV